MHREQRTPGTAASEIGGPFTLVDQNGQTVTDADFRGKWLLVYFGYTHCPDACPTALGDMAAALGDLDPAKRDKVRVLFISVDPERDTPAVMKDYVEAFDISEHRWPDGFDPSRSARWRRSIGFARNATGAKTATIQ